MWMLLVTCLLSAAWAMPPATLTPVPSPSPAPTPVPTATAPAPNPSVPSQQLTARPVPLLGPDCRLADFARADSLADWQRPLYRETALRAANSGRFDIELEDRFRLMTSDALYGRPGSILARKNDVLLQQYARQLEILGLQIDAKFASRALGAWRKAARFKGKVNWLPVKSYGRVMTGPELFRRCGGDLLDARVTTVTDSQMGEVGLVCPGVLLRLGVLRFGPQVRAPVHDVALGVKGDPSADREPLVVSLPDDELAGLLLDLAAEAGGAKMGAEKARGVVGKALEDLAKTRRFKRPADRDAWLRANRLHRCVLPAR